MQAVGMNNRSSLHSIQGFKTSGSLSIGKVVYFHKGQQGSFSFGISTMDKDKLIEDLADEIEEHLKGYSFFQQPPASVLAQKERTKIPEDPEKKFIKLQP